jgi:hypothetical protein
MKIEGWVYFPTNKDPGYWAFVYRNETDCIQAAREYVADNGGEAGVYKVIQTHALKASQVEITSVG